MKKYLLVGFMLVFVFGTTVLWAQDRTVSGNVTSEEDGSTLPGVNVILKGSATGTVTDIDGNYRLAVPSDGGTLVFSFVGLRTKEIEIGTQSTIDVQMITDVTELSEVVVTALNVSRETKTLPYAAQEVKAKNLNVTEGVDIKGALAGKIAGVQIDGQAGSKLGQFGKIRIRGAISLTSDNDPLYIVDGIPTTDPNNIDMNTVESINVLKGPNATSLYGQRADAGVVVITTKKGGQGLSVQLVSSTVFDRVSYLPKYQNLYGGGYDGDESFATFDYNSPDYNFPEMWQQFDGERYITGANNYADESWGPRLDGQSYVPWYAWWPDSPYYGETVPYEGHGDNIKDFYDTGVTLKNSVTLSGGNETFNGLLSYTNLDQSGIIPNSSLKKHFVNSNFMFHATEKLTVSTNIRFTTSETHGDFDDGYSNQVSGSFNSWFNRNLDTNKLKELSNLTTPNGHQASWNWWGPEYYTYGDGYQKPAFWFNPYTYLENYDIIGKNNNYAGMLTANYEISEKFSVSASASRDATEYTNEYYLPFVISNSAAPDLYNAWSNSFGVYQRQESENNYSGKFQYEDRFGAIDVTAFIGGNIRKNFYKRFSAEMPVGAKSGGLIIPDVFDFANAGEVPTPTKYTYDKQVNSIYGNISLGYQGFAYLDLSYRKDWSSALPSDNNGYGYPSIGGSFVLSELMDDLGPLSFAKVRAGWAQVGSDVDALLINPIYPIGQKPFNGSVLMYRPNTIVDPDITPSLNSSVEAGFDVKFIEDRIGLSFTYYNEKREDEIVSISVPSESGYENYLTNAGASRRKGVEISLTGEVLRSETGFSWTTLFNFSKNTTTVEALPEGLDAIEGPGGTDDWEFVRVMNNIDGEWGQLRGIGYARDDAGNKIVQSNGLYKTQSNVYFGSVLPDFTGGWLNTFTFKGLTLTASIDYQKGGKFFSLSEMWGYYSGLLEETAQMNDRGGNVRDAVSEGGGVHVIAVDESGGTYDDYVGAHDYFTQFNSNTIAEEFIHDKSYIKLREVSISYDFSRFLNSKVIKGAQIGVVGRNVALFGLSDGNYHGWDPSELAETYGENAQLPGTRSYGVNVRLTF